MVKVKLIDKTTQSAMKHDIDTMLILQLTNRPFTGECIEYQDPSGGMHKFKIEELRHMGAVHNGFAFDMCLVVTELP